MLLCGLSAPILRPRRAGIMWPVNAPDRQAPNGSAPPAMLALLALAGFLGTVSMRLCDAMLPALATVFATSTAQVATVISAFTVTYGLMQLVYGPLGDRYGKPRVIAGAVALCALACLAAALAPTLATLTLARCAMGAGAAAIVPMSLAWIGDSVPMAQRQEVLARYSTATLGGMVIGAFAGGLFTETVGWRWAFVALALPFAVASWALWRLDRLSPKVAGSPGQRLPYWRQVQLVLAVPWSRFVLLTVLTEGLFAFGCVAFVPTVLHARFALPLTQGGAVVATYALGGWLFAHSATPLLRRFEPARLVRWGGGLLAAGFCVLAWMPTWHWAVVGCLVGGFGLYAFHNNLQTQGTQLSSTARGVAMSLFACSLFLGQSLGVLLGSWVFTGPAAATGRFVPAYAVAGLALAGLGFFFSLRLQARARLAPA
jgi:MFS family permease